jgi:hypothetical protein
MRQSRFFSTRLSGGLPYFTPMVPSRLTSLSGEMAIKKFHNRPVQSEHVGVTNNVVGLVRQTHNLVIHLGGVEPACQIDGLNGTSRSSSPWMNNTGEDCQPTSNARCASAGFS